MADGLHGTNGAPVAQVATWGSRGGIERAQTLDQTGMATIAMGTHMKTGYVSLGHVSVSNSTILTLIR